MGLMMMMEIMIKVVMVMMVACLVTRLMTMVMLMMIADDSEYCAVSGGCDDYGCDDDDGDGV